MLDAESLEAKSVSLSRRHVADRAAKSVVIPVWVLTLMRLKHRAGGDLAAAWAALPSALPAGAPMPTEAEAATELLAHGLA